MSSGILDPAVLEVGSIPFIGANELLLCLSQLEMPFLTQENSMLQLGATLLVRTFGNGRRYFGLLS
jgi:hypothetical protein